MTHETNEVSISAAIQAEGDLLSALINGPETLADLPGFSADWFTDQTHEMIFSAIKEQFLNGLPCDIASLAAILAPCSELTGGIEPGCLLEDFGGADYFGSLASRGAPPVKESAFRIRDAWLRRQFLEIGQALISDTVSKSGVDILRTMLVRVTALAVSVSVVKL